MWVSNLATSTWKFFFLFLKIFLSKIYNFLFFLLTRIPFFKGLERRGRKSLLYWINVAATFFLMFLLFSTVAMGLTFIVFSKDLPSPNRLVDREVSMSTKIYDRNGTLLYDIYGDENRTLVTLDQVPEVVKQATIAVEDKNFYRHRGFDLFGIVRAFFNVILTRDLQGGSTITQQLVKNTLLSQERTVVRKIKEFVLSIQIEARYSKDQILQMYFNETPYGGQAIGIQAAAENYFGKSASELTLAESSLLAGLTPAPSKYSPYRDPELAKWRQGQVLRRMREDGYITKEQEDEAKKTPLDFKPEGSKIRAPHFVMYVREILADHYGETLVETGGLKVTTTLDINLQDKYQQIVREELEKDSVFQVTNGALLAMDPKTGEIWAMVGSKDYFASDIDGQFNVTTSPSRQPGSSIKPLMYATAFKQGYYPATTLIDIPTTFDAGPGQPPYQPQDFAQKYHGILSVRQSIGNSKNIPAVKMLSLIGVSNLLDTAHDLGITTLNDPSRYGVALTLGGGEVKMLDMVTAFSVFATGGIKHNSVVILKVADHNGQVLEEFKPNSGVRVLSEQVAYLISNILSDYDARQLTFGGGNQLGLSISGRTVAVKTGTTDDNRDNWAFGYVPSHKDSPVGVTIGSWIGNNDNSPMNPNFFAGAARIWNAAMIEYLKDKPNVDFVRPGGIAEACVDNLSGKAGGLLTGGETRCDIFISGTVPTAQDNWRIQLEICTVDGKIASDACRKAGKSEKRPFIKVKAEKTEWQGDVDAWVSQNFAGQPQYFPPVEVSTTCFDNSGSVVNCTGSSAGPILTTSGIVFHDYQSGTTLTSTTNLPKDFAVWAEITPQPGTKILSAWFHLENNDLGCTPDPDVCNWGPSTTCPTCKEEKITTICSSTCVYKSSEKANFKNVPAGNYTLTVDVVDSKGGATTVSLPITVGP